MASIPLPLSKKINSSETQADGMCGRLCDFFQLRIVSVPLEKFSEHMILNGSSTNS